MPAPQVPITAIYFDSEPLAVGWPKLSKSVARTVEIAVNSGVPVFLPQPVETELEIQFERNLTLANERAKDAYEQLTELSLIERLPFRDVDLDAALEAHRAKASELKAAYRLQPVSLTGKSVADLFSHAARRQPPFKVVGSKGHEHKDAGFKDAVIAFSVIDHLSQRRGPHQAVLVTSDRGFAGIEDLLPRGQLTVASADEVFESLLTGKTLADLWDVETSVRGTVRVPGHNRGPEFEFIGDELRLVSHGAEPGYAAPFDMTFCHPGDPVPIDTGGAGSFLGRGPAEVKGHRWQQVWYAGELRLTGEPLVAPGVTGAVSGRFNCRGRLRGVCWQSKCRNDDVFSRQHRGQRHCAGHIQRGAARHRSATGFLQVDRFHIGMSGPICSVTARPRQLGEPGVAPYLTS